MSPQNEQPHLAAPAWAPRVTKRMIAQLYHTDAQGLVDAELIDEVGYALFCRCESILQASEAARGNVLCPQCRSVFRHTGPEDALRCDQCDWQGTWTAYKKSYQHKQLSSGGATLFFKGYLEQFPKARTPREKMVQIDTLIHRYHGELIDVAASEQEGRPRRSAAVNLIEGKLTDVVAFLDELTYSDQSTPEARQNLRDWRIKGDHIGEHRALVERRRQRE